MEIVINLDKEDWVKSQPLIMQEFLGSSRSGRKTYRMGMMIWAVVAFLFLSLLNSTDKFEWTIAILASAIIVLIIVFFVIIIKNLVSVIPPVDDGVFIGDHHFTFDNDGIKVKGNGYEASFLWGLVKQVIRKNGFILIFLDTTTAFVFPETKLENPDEFYNYINAHYKKI